MPYFTQWSSFFPVVPLQVLLNIPVMSSISSVILLWPRILVSVLFPNYLLTSLHKCLASSSNPVCFTLPSSLSILVVPFSLSIISSIVLSCPTLKLLSLFFFLPPYLICYQELVHLPVLALIHFLHFFLFIPIATSSSWISL